MSSRAAQGTAAGVYRCVPCGHGGHLTAWATASVHGPLGADGHVTTYDYDEETDLHEDSIQCTVHPDEVLEKHIDGVWCRWWSCFRCGGTGRADPDRGRYACPFPGEPGVGHAGWRPAGEIPDLPAWPGLGTGHVLSQDLRYFRPGHPSPDCRTCGAGGPAHVPRADRRALRLPCRVPDPRPR